MSAAKRIEQASACKVINLTESEKNIYSGCGWKLARFVDETLVELYDPFEAVEYTTDTQALAAAAVDAALAWLSEARGEVWLVMCSCCQLCEPRRITCGDASALAHLCCVFADASAEF